MIGNSNSVNPSYGTNGVQGMHTHEHAVTNCIHDEHEIKKNGGAGGRRSGTASAAAAEKQEELSLRDMLMNGFRSFSSKSKGFLAKVWYSDGTENGEAVKEQQGKTTEISAYEEDVPSNIPSGVTETASAVLATAAMKPKETSQSEDDAAERKISGIEGAVSGGLKREEEGIRRFFRQFRERVGKHTRFFKKEVKEEHALMESNTDFGLNDNSYLLDSYNKSGEYATLARGKETEGKFRVRG